MPRPVFDIEQYELRGIKPTVYTDAQKKALNETLARVNGQIDWTAQLLGFNGPNYWGYADYKTDGSYAWKGLVETMHEKRQMQVGTYGVFNKNLSYSEWPTPLNREHINASGDAPFHIFEQDGQTKIAPYGLGEEVDYMHFPTVFAGGSYIFDGDLEVEGRELDLDEYVRLDKFIEHERTWTRLTVKSEAVGGALLVRRVGTDAEFCPLELSHWHDISDWTSESTQDQYIGLWGNKGAAVSFDFAFDALDLHGLDERNGIAPSNATFTIRPHELLEKAGLEPTFWTSVSSELFAFKVEDCATGFPVVPPYVNEPYAGHPWEPTYSPDGLEFMRCDENCNYTLVGRQYFTEEDNHDNGEYESFCSNTGSPGFTDCVDQIIPLTDSLNNGTMEDDLPPVGLKDEGEYDRIPWKTLDRFEFEFIPKADCAFLNLPCLEWIYDTALDNGDMESISLKPTQDGSPTPLIFESNPGGPSSSVVEGFYDKSQEVDYHDGQNQPGCEFDQWAGYDNGSYDTPRLEPDCDPGEQLVFDNGRWRYVSGPEAYELCKADNLPYGGNYLGTPTPDVYQSPEIADQGEYAQPNYDDEAVCPSDIKYISLNEEFEDSLLLAMRPDMRNAFTPLRLWKDRVLTNVDQVPNAELADHNFLVADENCGATPEDSYRHFVRLPLEYPREGKFWNRAVAVCNNMSYFSTPAKLSGALNPPRELSPSIYSETFDKKVPDYETFYEEDFLVSSISSDTTDVPPDFEDSGVFRAPAQSLPFKHSVITEYEPLDQRVPTKDGEWRGSYYVFGTNLVRTGHISQDLATHALRELQPEDYPVYDFSIIKQPNIQFLDDSSLAPMRNYIVSYAYFAADFAAADEPVFDPMKSQCWRESVLDCLEPTPDGEDCQEKPFSTHTQYILHPTT